ncbi:MAG: DUF2341 domain-containing protein, partial [Fibrobacteria bacterium]|nr:DUF2341 domain-containing protein [Fibrobacteria bacterium]
SSTWCNVAVTYTYGTGNSIAMYVNGAAVSGSWTTGDGENATTIYNQTIKIGHGEDPASVFWDGKIDEVRLSKTIRSADWVNLCYETQKADQTALIQADDLSTWSYNTDLTLNTTASGADVSGNETNFPVLIRLTADNFTFSQAQDSGQDLRFAKSDGTVLKYEIERWDATNQLAEVWVKVDTVYGNNKTQSMKMYWGKADAVSKSDGGTVFDTANGFVGVWHLREEGNTTANGYQDGTLKNYDGTGGSMDGNSDVTGLIGKAQTFDGINDYIRLYNKSDFNMSGNNVTASLWFKSGNTQYQTPGFLFGKFAGGTPGSGYYLGVTTSNTVYFNHRATTNQIILSNSFANDGSWYYVTIALDGSNALLYLNGTNPQSDGYTDLINNAHSFGLDIAMGGATNTYPYLGIIDEMRFSQVLRSANWIKLCYENQKLYQTLVQFSSSAEDYKKATRFTFFTTSLGLTGDVPNIPLLLRIGPSDIDFSVTKIDGSDLLFLDSAGQQLYHEVVHWDRGNDSGLVWVRETNMENADGDFITMYYGCDDCNNNYARTDSVWVGYVGVWHLNAPETEAVDASGKSNDGIYSDVMAFNTGVTTIYASSFDGIDDDIKTGSSGFPTGNAERTLSGWIKLTGGSVYEPLFSYGQDVAGQAIILAQTEDGIGIAFKTHFWGQASQETGWTHLAVTISSTASTTDDAEVYINGAPITETTLTYSSQTLNTTLGLGPFIGRLITNANARDPVMINEVRLSDQEMSADYIKLSYENQKLTGGLYTTVDVTGPVDVPDLKLWLRADQGAEEASADDAENGDAVQYWRDQSGNGNDVEQSTSSNRPILVTNTLNGKPVLRFDNSNDYLIRNDALGMSGNPAMTMFVVMKGPGGTDAILHLGGPNTNDQVYMSSEAGYRHGSSNKLFNENFSGAYALGTFRRSESATTGSEEFFKNGVEGTQLSSVSPSSTITIPGSSVYTLVGARYYSSSIGYYCGGDIAEILLYNRELTEAERIKVESYLTVKYSLGPPSNATSLTATGGNSQVKLSWTRPVSLSAIVDTVGIWARSDKYPDSTRNGSLVGYFGINDSSYTWSMNFPGLWYFTLLTRDSNGVWSNTTDKAQDTALVSSGDFGIKYTFNTAAIGVTEDQTNFPMLIRLTLADSMVFNACPSATTGGHLRFRDDDGETILDYEVERWNTSIDSAEIWVKVPRVDGNSSTDFVTMEYRNCTNTDQSDGGAVFDTTNGFEAVWHLEEDGNTSTDGYIDATVNSNHGDGVSMAIGTSDQASVVGMGQSFDGAADYIDLGSQTSTSPLCLNGSPFSISMWLKRDAGGGNNQRIIEKATGGSATGGFSLITSTSLDFLFYMNGSASLVSNTSAYIADEWYYLTIVMESATQGYIYLNGAVLSLSTHTPALPVSTTANMYMSRYVLAGDYFFTGDLDEVRMSSSPRSAEWIKLCYYTQHPDSSAKYITEAYPQLIYVDSALGDDDNSCQDAENPSLPKLTIASAVACPKHDKADTMKVIVMPGTYTDSILSKGTCDVMVKGFDANHPPVLNGNRDGGSYTNTIWPRSRIHLRNFIVKSKVDGARGILIASGDDSISVIGCRIINDGAIKHIFGICVNGAENVNILIANNIVFGATTYGIGTLSDSISIINNVVYGPTNIGIYLFSNLQTHFTLTNNIIMNCDVGIQNYASGDIGLFSNNLFNNVVTQISGGNESDAAAITADPLFVNFDPFSPNFMKLSPNSPALNAGTTDLASGTPYTKTVTTDYWRTTRPYGSEVDIGVYEGVGYSDVLSGDFDSLTITTYSNDSIAVKNSKWKITFSDTCGAGISGFYDMDDSTTDLLGQYPLFDLDINGTRLSTFEVSHPIIVSQNRVHTCVKQAVDVNANITVTVYYHLYASGHIYIQSEVANISAGAVSNQTLDYHVELEDADAGHHNEGAANGYGYLVKTSNRDVYFGVTEALNQPSTPVASAWSGDTTMSSNRITWDSDDIDFIAKQRVQHHFLVYVGSESMDASLASNLYADSYYPSELSASAGMLSGEVSWQDHLKGQWPFNDATGDTVTDVSLNGHNGYFSGPTWTVGREGTGLSFASGGLVTVPDNADYEAGTNRTFMFWAWISSAWSGYGSQANFVSKGTDLMIERMSGNDHIVFTAGGVSAETVDNPPYEEWIHIAGVMEGAGNIRLYINGVLQAYATGASFSENASALIFGNDASANAVLRGGLDEPRVYHQAMDQEQIQAISNHGFAEKTGLYMLRANNNNRMVALMNANGPATRFQPCFQIANWYGGAVPKYVYVDGVQMSSGTDFYSTLDDYMIDGNSMGNILEIQFNRTFNEQNVDIFIDNNDSTGSQGASARMKKLYTTVTAGDQINVKNLSGITFGERGSNEWEFIVDLDATTETTDGDGGIYSWKSSEASPVTAISSATDLTGADSITLDQFRFDWAGLSGKAWTSGDPGSVYSIADCSGARLKMSTGAITFNAGDPDVVVNRTYTFYPTGRLFISQSITSLSSQPATPQISIEGLVNINQANDAWNTTYSSDSGRAGKLSASNETSFNGFGVSVLGLEHAGGDVTGKAAVTGQSISSTALKLNFDNANFEVADATITVNYMLDFTKDFTDSASLDSTLADVQNPATLSALVGTAVTDDALDFNGDGFAEGDGAYTFQASSGVAQFQMGITKSRFYPAFRIKNWNTVTAPEIVLVGNQEQVRDYQYNAYVDVANRQLIMQFNQVWRGSGNDTLRTVYVSAKDGLAVTMGEFRAVAGVGEDSLFWTTESELDNLGFYLLRRVKPCQSSVLSNQYSDEKALSTPGSIAPLSPPAPLSQTSGNRGGEGNYSSQGDKGIFSSPSGEGTSAALDSLNQIPGAHCLDPSSLIQHEIASETTPAVFDTSWSRLSNKLIPGPEGGRSGSTRNYQHIDTRVKYGITYQYILVSVDFHGQEESFGPVEVTPLNPYLTVLYQNVPNPFNPVTVIKYDLKDRAKVSIKIFNIKGQLICELVKPNRYLAPGRYQIIWDGRDRNGVELPSGHYLYYMTTKGYRKAKKMLIVK